eukprot:516823-Prorocentrum_minimum.AAC.4
MVGAGRTGSASGLADNRACDVLCESAGDTSTTWGMGGFLDGDRFAISWAQLRDWPNNPACFPSWDCKDKHQLAYLELFAGKQNRPQ